MAGAVPALVDSTSAPSIPAAGAAPALVDSASEPLQPAAGAVPALVESTSGPSMTIGEDGLLRAEFDQAGAVDQARAADPYATRAATSLEPESPTAHAVADHHPQVTPRQHVDPDRYHERHREDWVLELRHQGGSIFDGNGGAGIDAHKVRSFQARHGLRADGLIGPKTIDAVVVALGHSRASDRPTPARDPLAVSSGVPVSVTTEPPTTDGATLQSIPPPLMSDGSALQSTPPPLMSDGSAFLSTPPPLVSEAPPTIDSALSRLPAPVATGDIQYYRNRNNDFIRRYPQAPPSPPDYYLDYGDKYAHRFTEQLRPKLSPCGQAWVDQTFRRLQEEIEARRDFNPQTFDHLERDNKNFREFAYRTHPQAYIDGGLHTHSLSPISGMFYLRPTSRTSPIAKACDRSPRRPAS